MMKDQSDLIDDLKRRGQSGTASRVKALSPIAFEQFKRDLLMRFAADGRFERID